MDGNTCGEWQRGIERESKREREMKERKRGNFFIFLDILRKIWIGKRGGNLESFFFEKRSLSKLPKKGTYV